MFTKNDLRLARKFFGKYCPVKANKQLVEKLATEFARMRQQEHFDIVSLLCEGCREGLELMYEPEYIRLDQNNWIKGWIHRITSPDSETEYYGQCHAGAINERRQEQTRSRKLSNPNL
jgi:hypothetical protein